MTPEQVEKEYNNRARVPEHARIFERWERDAAMVRETLPCEPDRPYGPHARHRMDLFPAARARGTLLFVHGGYWRSLDKSMFSWLAPAFVAQGLNVAMPSYRLCPEVRIEEIADDVAAAAAWLLAAKEHALDVGPVVAAGHSAGGHLVAALFARPAERLGFDPARIAGGVPISGIFDFAPMRLFSFNADFRLDEAAVERLALAGRPRSVGAPLVVAVGGEESGEFIRQSRLLADAWAPQVRELQVLAGLNHFTVVDALGETGHPLHETAVALFPR